MAHQEEATEDHQATDTNQVHLEAVASAVEGEDTNATLTAVQEQGVVTVHQVVGEDLGVRLEGDMTIATQSVCATSHWASGPQQQLIPFLFTSRAGPVPVGCSGKLRSQVKYVFSAISPCQLSYHARLHLSGYGRSFRLLVLSPLLLRRVSLHLFLLW